MADSISTKAAVKNLAEEFKAAPAETKLAMAREIFKDDPMTFLGEALNISAYNPLSPALTVPPEVVKMDDILTQQMISTYRNEIAPLVILTQKN